MLGRSRWGIAALVLVCGAQLRAEPYMAVREGQKCSGCHVNMTGGGKRTQIVSAHARDILHYPRYFRRISAPLDPFTGDINQYLSVGGNLRTTYTAVFQDKPDGSGRVKNDTAFRGRLEENRIDITEAVGFVEARLIPDVLTFYIDQRFAPSTDTREAWGMLQLPWDVFVKAGWMFLPYGLQLQDDTAFTRGGRNGSVNTGFSFEQQQAAFEIGYERGALSVVAAVSEGAPRDRDVQLTGTIYTMLTELPVIRNLLLGASASRSGPTDPPRAQSLVWGLFAGTNIGPFTYLGEVDFRADDSSRTGGRTQGTFIHSSELNYLAFDWLNVKVSLDYADDDGDLTLRTNDSENRVSFGLEPFWSRFLQTRIFYRISNGVEMNPGHNQDVLTAEVHVFF